jgi:solute carrier family 38 (sodium-coupled neutral amino acid transporter), member 11
MPYALKEAGFWSGMFLIVMVACCSDYTLRLIVRLGNRTKRKYYEDLCASQFGHAGYVFVVGAMGIFAYGAAVAYLIGIGASERTIRGPISLLRLSSPPDFPLPSHPPFHSHAGDNMAIVVSSWSGTDLKTNPWVKRVTLSAIAIGAVLPLAMLKNMSALSKTSAFSICSVIFIIGVVIKNAITGPGDAPVPVTDEDKELKVIDSNFFPAVGVIAFAFVCHHACFIVYNTLRDNTEARWAKTVHITLSVATSVMFTLAVAAFVTFRGIMKGSFLTNYSYTDPLCNLMRCLFATCQTLTYPIELFVARHSIHALMFPAQKWTQQQHIVITLLLWGSSLAIALNVTDLSIVLELTGGVAAVSIGFLMPGALHAKMTPHLDWRIWRNKGMAKKAAACKEFAVSFFVFVVGVLAMLFTVITMSAHLMHHEGPHDAFEDLGHEEGGHIVPPGPTELGDRL